MQVGFIPLKQIASLIRSTMSRVSQKYNISDFVLNGHKRVSIEIIIISDSKKVVLCLEKIKSKNLGQNPDNLKHFLLKDFNCDC